MPTFDAEHDSRRCRINPGSVPSRADSTLLNARRSRPVCFMERRNVPCRAGAGRYGGGNRRTWGPIFPADVERSWTGIANEITYSPVEHGNVVPRRAIPYVCERGYVTVRYDGRKRIRNWINVRRLWQFWRVWQCRTRQVYVYRDIFIMIRFYM